MRRLSLTGTFALVSLTTMAVLAGVLIWLVATTLQAQAREAGERAAQSVVALGVERVVTIDSSTFWAHPEKFPFLNDELLMIGSSKRGTNIVRLQLLDNNGGLLWSSTPEDEGLSADERGLLRSAVDSAAPMSTVEAQDGGDVLSVFVPVTYGDRYSGSFGVAEVELSWTQTESLVRQAAGLVAGVILVVLLLAWLLLFRTVHQASTTLREQSVENEHLALHDPLTGLPNRRLLSDRLERAIAASGRTGQTLALMILDVDRFKEINDTLGHDRGDRLLVEISQRLGSVIRDADTVARLGGDEFAVLAPVVDSMLEGERLARRISAVFDEPFVVDDIPLHVDCSIGLAVLPDHAVDEKELFQRADIAMYAAKTEHVGVKVYDVDSDRSTTDWLLLGELRKALGTDQLSMHYQPKIELTSGDVVGLEALLRWTHPTRGPIPPNEFIPLAESSGLIKNLTRFVLEMVLTQMAEWDRVEARFAHLPVAVNLSARNLIESDFAEFVEDLLASHMIDPSRLDLELTETDLIRDPLRTHAMLQRLSDLGIGLAMDDYGTGYTSMVHLESMPLTTLKIDRSLVVRLGDDDGVTLVRAIVELAHEFGLEVVAEGVEDESITEQLRALGCDVGQGYLWSRPVPGDALPDVLFHMSFRRAKAGASVR